MEGKTKIVVRTMQRDIKGLPPKEVVLSGIQPENLIKKIKSKKKKSADSEISSKINKVKPSKTSPPKELPVLKTKKESKTKKKPKEKKKKKKKSRKQKPKEPKEAEEAKAKVKTKEKERKKALLKTKKLKEKLSHSVETNKQLKEKLQKTQEKISLVKKSQQKDRQIQEQAEQLKEENQELKNKLPKLEQQIEQSKQIKEENQQLKEKLAKKASRKRKPSPQKEKKKIVESKESPKVEQASKRKKQIFIGLGALATAGLLIFISWWLLKKPGDEVVVPPQPEGPTEPITPEPTEPQPQQPKKSAEALIPVEQEIKVNNLETLLAKEQLPGLGKVEGWQPNLQLPQTLKEKPKNLLIFGKNEPKLGLVIKTDNSLTALSTLNKWEPEMPSDLKILFAQQAPPQSSFKPDLSYENLVIRFQEVDNLNKSLHYTLIKNKIIITTSRQDMDLVLGVLLSEQN